MAKTKDDLDLAAKPQGGSSKLKKFLIIAGGSMLLMAASVGTTLFIAKQFLMIPGGEAGKESAQAEEEIKPFIYVDLDPPFVVNFEDQGMIRFMQVGVQMMVRDQVIADQLQHHMPVIRNNLLLVFSSLDYASISTREAKEKLRLMVLAEVQAILEERGEEGNVEAAYFTSFVMQ